MSQKNVGSKKMSGQIKLWTQKNIFGSTIFYSKKNVNEKILAPKKFGLKKIMSKKILAQKRF